MSTWQHRARLLIAIPAIALAVVVAMTWRRQAIAPTSTPVTRADPNAVVESAEGQTIRINRDQEEVRIDYDQLLTYTDGGSKLLGVTVTTVRDGDTFVVTSDQAKVDDKESNLELEGNVRLKAKSGMTAHTDRATYREEEGIIRADGPVDFTRGRMRGSGVGATYDKNKDVINLFDQVQVHMENEGDESPGTDISSHTAELNQNENLMHFEGSVKAQRGAQILEADSALAHLGAEESTFEAVDLRGNSRITGTEQGTAGGLRAMSGRDIDLKYAEDGETLQRAIVMGDAILQLTGEGDGPGRQISAATIDITLAPDGSTPIALAAQDNAELQMPAEKGVAARTIRAQTLDATGEAPAGLRNAKFGGQVRFTERTEKGERTATSGGLTLALKPGFGTIEDATFSQNVRFTDGGTVARAATARYVMGTGVLELSGSEPSLPRPNVNDGATSIDALRINLTLEGPHIEATGAVKSLVQPERRKPDARDGSKAKVPSMLKSDQPINVIADALNYDSGASKATYTGNVRLWQSDTTIKANSIIVDDDTGDLTATGEPVFTTAVLLQETKDGKKDRAITTAKAKQFKYEEAVRRATYTGDAYMNGPQGDLRAEKVELHMKPSGDELDRAEAYESVTLAEPTRKTTGTRMTYFTADQRYVVSGTPVTIRDACGRDMTGRTVTWYKDKDLVVVDGSQQMRTRTQGSGACP